MNRHVFLFDKWLLVRVGFWVEGLVSSLLMVRNALPREQPKQQLRSKCQGQCSRNVIEFVIKRRPSR